MSISVLQRIRMSFSEIEDNLTDAISSIGPWITPLPSAALVANAVVRDLDWNPALGWITAAIIESLGLTTVNTSLKLWDYNGSKRKSDPKAPFVLSASLVCVYLFSTIGLTILLDIFPELGRYAPALFPLIALVGAINLALRSEHRRRLFEISQTRNERKSEKNSSRNNSFSSPAQEVSNLLSNDQKFDTIYDKALAVRKSNLSHRLNDLVSFYLVNPSLGATDLAKSLGVSRQTIYSYIKLLEDSGRIRRSDKGMEVTKNNNDK